MRHDKQLYTPPAEITRCFASRVSRVQAITNSIQRLPLLIELAIFAKLIILLECALVLWQLPEHGF